MMAPMGFLDRLLGREDRASQDRGHESEPTTPGPTAATEDERALERYRYLVRTAPPERIEEAHEEAFAKLTPEQRRLALEQLTRQVPDERPGGDDPRSLARLATRAETRQPGTLERAFGRGAMGGAGMGGLGMGSGLLGTFVTAFAGTLVAQALFSELADGGDGGDGGGDGGDGGDDGGDGGDGGDAGGDDSGADSGGGDVIDSGGNDFGADLSGGDLGGGDFGGF
jgi:hypothetical protein